MKRFFAMVLVGVIAMAFAAGCGGSKQAQKPGRGMAADLDGAPDWVMKGCAAFSGEKRNRICGVGSMEGTNNLSLCRTAAQNRGRTDIARQFETMVRAMYKDYQATVTGGGMMGEAADDEQKVVDAAIQTTKAKIAGVRLEDSWFSPNGRCFALMVLDLKGFQDTVNKMSALPAEVRKFVEKNAEKAWDELDQLTGDQAAAAE